jgi:hypothetical protein
MPTRLDLNHSTLAKFVPEFLACPESQKKSPATVKLYAAYIRRILFRLSENPDEFEINDNIDAMPIRQRSPARTAWRHFVAFLGTLPESRRPGIVPPTLPEKPPGRPVLTLCARDKLIFTLLELGYTVEMIAAARWRDVRDDGIEACSLVVPPYRFVRRVTRAFIAAIKEESYPYTVTPEPDLPLFPAEPEGRVALTEWMIDRAKLRAVRAERAGIPVLWRGGAATVV